MPIIIVHGIPSAIIPQSDLENLWNNIKSAVADIGKLAITKDEVIVFFPEDVLSFGLGEKIIVFVEGLLKQSQDKPERTPSVRQQVASTILQVLNDFPVSHHLPQCKKIEVFVGEFDASKNGYVIWKKEE